MFTDPASFRIGKPSRLSREEIRACLAEVIDELQGRLDRSRSHTGVGYMVAMVDGAAEFERLLAERGLRVAETHDANTL